MTPNKEEELKQKLSRLQSRAYNLQFDIERLISDLDSEEKVKQEDKEKQGGKSND